MGNQSEAEKLRQNLNTIGGIKCLLFPCTVKSFDSGKMTIDCESIVTGADFVNVRLRSIEKGEKINSIIIVPKIGSFVDVIVNNNDFADMRVLTYTEVEQIYLNGESLGGIVKAIELKEQLDKTNEVISAIVNSLSNWTPVPNDGGAALKTYFSSQIAGKQVGDYSDIQNETVKHGE